MFYCYRCTFVFQNDGLNKKKEQLIYLYRSAWCFNGSRSSFLSLECWNLNRLWLMFFLSSSRINMEY